MFKFKDPVIYKEPQFILKRPGVGRLRVVERDLVQRIGLVIILLTFFFMTLLSALDQGGNPVFYTHWYFKAGCVVLPIIMYYILRLGYVEFDNVRERVIIKRYQYKYLPARVIQYQDIDSIGLNLNESATEHGSTLTKYFFKLKLKNGRIVPLFNVYREKTGKKIETWMNDHLKFKINAKENKLKKRPKLFNFSKKD